jgi:hypothetical protein
MRQPMPSDAEIKRRLRAEQTDPIVMHIIVRKNTQMNLEQVISAACFEPAKLKNKGSRTRITSIFGPLGALDHFGK